MAIPGPRSATFKAIRGWLLLGVAVALIVNGLIQQVPSQVMLGFSWLGAEPMLRAGEEKPPV